MLALTPGAAAAVKSLVAALGLGRGAGLRITAMPRPGDGYEVALTPSPAPAENDRVLRADGAVVFVDPPATSALGDSLLDARIEASEVRFALRREG